MTKILQGTVHGRIIQIEEDLGLSDGQEVEIQLQVKPKSHSKPGDGFLRTEGALTDDNEWDAIMAEIRQARKQERHSAIAELEYDPGNKHSHKRDPRKPWHALW